MFRNLNCLLSLTFTTVAFANTDQTSYQQFVPKHWKIIQTVQGDLNRDGQKDVVLVIEENNPKNIIINDGFANPKLNINPRTLLVLFKTAEGYQLISKNQQIPSENDAEAACLADPLEDGNVQISKDILKISLNYWFSCGSWYVTNNTFSFRYQDRALKLIGFDQMIFHRASGEQNNLSINFATQKQKRTTDKNGIEDGQQLMKTQWSKIKQHYDLRLEQINFKELPEFK